MRAILHKLMQQPFVTFSKQELKQRLSDIQYRVTQEADTEPPFKNEYYKTKDPGEYFCIVCGDKLFGSQHKYNSGCGWPAFWGSYDSKKIKEINDQSHGMIRIEVRCQKCNAHLGHKFDDGPAEQGGIRYCINSASLQFKKENK
ncbi:unnamed protein product [Paramecium pentaurelia]|uniref:Peptide-methionine (R)-S-oxide reductase n=1 Tax=Paramecium pentaurelia TaxID=43138 RepID=A0A8S1WJY1_9CILI|nr:unnamed protein product [Paramecium pentaurelia]